MPGCFDMQKKLNEGYTRSVEKGYIEYEEKYKMDVTRETAANGC
ncbi:hypothetical protein ABE128_18015 [Bacillus subtilis]|nr:hypothetical protein [Bacillus subtilis]